MAEWIERVRAYYDNDPEAEWRRLDGRVQFRNERLVTLRAIERQLPPPTPAVRMLDAGGGPGRYTIDLARRGYTVTLLDLSAGNVALARAKIAEAGAEVAARVAGCIVGTFTDLGCFRDGAFDAVLCLGAALSHLIEPDARRQALAELRRVARPGAPLLISALNQLAVYRGLVLWPDSWAEVGGDGHGLAAFARHGYGDGRTGSWPSYAFLPDEFVGAIEAAGLTVRSLYGAQGIAAHLPPANLEALMTDPQRWPAWRDLLLATCDHPAVVGVSAHLIAAAVA